MEWKKESLGLVERPIEWEKFTLCTLKPDLWEKTERERRERSKTVYRNERELKKRGRDSVREERKLLKRECVTKIEGEGELTEREHERERETRAWQLCFTENNSVKQCLEK